MSFDYKRILASAGVFLGVLLLMCLAAKFVIKTHAEITDGVIRDGSGDLKSQNDTGKSAKDGNEASNAQEGSNNGNKGGLADGKSDGANGGTDTSDDGINGTGNGNADSQGNTDSQGSSEGGSTSGNPNDAGNNADNSAKGENGNTNSDESGPDALVGSDTGKSGFIVCIDAAHQKKDNSSSEPIGPGAEKTKVKCTTGATGVSGLLEYEFTLTIAQKLKAELLTRGYGVIMTRESHDVDISDATRAKDANESASIVLHIHGNADEREGIAGVMAFAPGEDNPYVKGQIREECRNLGKCIVDKLAASTSAKNWGVIDNNNLSALNWTTIPASHVEVGYLTNAEEEKLLKTEEYQNKIVKGIADGIDAYYETH
ncbi:MAG: N-acetylmuramoyl-L-alanine amidase [Lachnospiraceae bacterium]|nr:N-acetylmuramoyl-L-alanine amidase [Lachnospiraceae bacterium]